MLARIEEFLGPKKIGLFQFSIIIFIFTNFGPFGFEYVIEAVGVGYALLIPLVFYTIYGIPMSLICTELSSIMPSKHGYLIWGYRGFHSINPKIGDLIGFIHAINATIYQLLWVCIAPIVISSYVTTLVDGGLNYTDTFFIRFGVIIISTVINIANIANVLWLQVYASIITILAFAILFFWRTPEMDPSTQWTASCPTMDWALALTAAIWKFAGFEYATLFSGDLSFPVSKMMTAYSCAIVLGLLTLWFSITATATISSDCDAWYDGYYAYAYKSAHIGVYYTVVILAIILYFCGFMSAQAVSAREIWVLSQPYFVVLRDGSMLLEEDEAQLETSHIREKICINVFPTKWFGKVWHRTGSPIAAVLVVASVCILTNFYLDFEDLVEFNTFTYFVYFSFEISSLMILKYTEPNANRAFEIPFGLVGAWITVSIAGVFMGIVFFVLVIDHWKLFLYDLLMNFIFVCYYFIGKKWLNRMHQQSIIEESAMENNDVQKNGDNDADTELDPLL